MEFSNQKISEFLKDLSSSSPAPGGGAVAGFISALSASLNSMVYSLTIGKKKYEQLSDDEKEKINRFKKESDKFIEESLSFMQEDKENFMFLMNSYSMPKNTEDEKEKRSIAIEENTVKAMEVPYRLCKRSFEFYNNLEIMKKYGNKMLFSDLQISAVLLHAAIESSIINVKVNLDFLKDKNKYLHIYKELDDILEKSEKLKKEIVS
ncbi:cyclodeaminase/cyclohydrolase family protein [Clostridium sp. BJN0001]|uniref:cyclodeaminase/cyclohydrolase family protein n=1 Tax=Clostridium sp. BJN0001 TaxID=2930219 RepID=UPI001FD50BEF|nr:cyclodeaminase/cyclohydrolase family protein [Clostridium sp. BJN0001]